MKKLLEILGAATVLTSNNLGVQPATAYVPPPQTSDVTGVQAVDEAMQQFDKFGVPRPELSCEGLVRTQSDVRQVGADMVEGFEQAAQNREITTYMSNEIAIDLNASDRLQRGDKPPVTTAERMARHKEDIVRARLIEPQVVDGLKRTSVLLRSGPEMMDKVVLQPIEQYMGGCPGDVQYQAQAPETAPQKLAALPPPVPGRKP